MLPIRPGIFAEINTEEAPTGLHRAGFVRTCTLGAKDPWAGEQWDLKCPNSHSSPATLNVRASPCFAPVHTFAGHSQGSPLALGVVAPVELRLIGEGVAATVRFLAEPYDLAAGASGTAPS